MHIKRWPAPARRVAFALGAAAALAQPRGAAGQDAPARAAAGAGAALGADLYRLFAAGDGNIVFSPYSVSEALALLSSGADGRTREELLGALHWTQGPDQMHAAFGDQDLKLQSASQGGSVLTLANSIWCQSGREPRAAFVAAARQYYRTEVRVADFAEDLPVSQHMINYWVSAKTGGKITNLVPNGALTPRTRLVIANAIYFKGQWERPFDPRHTAPLPFFAAHGLTVMAPTMERTGSFRTKGFDACELLELPYAGGKLSMVIVLPRARDGLSGVEKGLGAAGISEWLASLDLAVAQELEVTLPLFKMTYAADLASPLAQLGVSSAFRQEADFSRINGRRDLLVSDVLHKAFVEVNEEGTEAAAATGIAVSKLAVMLPRKFAVDHPFLFLIRDTSTGSLLFLGRIVDPRAM
jgi:serpin B